MQKSQPKLISKHYSRLDTSSAANKRLNDMSQQKLALDGADEKDSVASGTIDNGFNSSILFISNTYEQPEEYEDGAIITRSTSASRPIIMRPKTT